jgi:hypothetical protein
MKKKWGRTKWYLIKILIMENKYGLVELSVTELKECNGGFVLLIISAFMTSYNKIHDLVDGYIEGYRRATTTP